MKEEMLMELGLPFVWEMLGHPSILFVANTTLRNGPHKGLSVLAYLVRML